MPPPVRAIIDAPRDADGLFIQSDDTGPARELVENHNRQNFAHIASYADRWTGNTRTFDPAGNYNCGACNKDDGEYCLIIPGTIDQKAGGCRYWENLCAGDPELKMPGVWDRDKVDYGVAVNGQGFGCFRCTKYVERAKTPDSQGRTFYCRKGDFRTLWNACCTFNGTPVKG